MLRHLMLYLIFFRQKITYLKLATVQTTVDRTTTSDKIVTTAVSVIRDIFDWQMLNPATRVFEHFLDLELVVV